ncbi:hypothetical protein [Bacillus tuaregi]|uniref:hypothetical protein n=1 Tax=Bacillus tuaregi TaxID=1816695 RepID=UPI0008F8F911|nr:hypothetical protein [Bacillus tuaregi]
MMRRLLTSILIGLCLTFMMTATVYATTEEMFEKQAEIDQILFEEKSGELEAKGIIVTHTASLEDKIEIGIADFTKEKAQYFYDLLGKEEVIIVAGEQAVAFGADGGPADNNLVEDNAAMEATEEGAAAKEKESSKILYVLGAGVIVLGAGIAFILRKKTNVKG